ncbi:MAG TPA: protein kinase [Candidatus Krumholzibacteria bacterium]|nr:protein kinase [Candidatus Krumholzibacteria bacterium]
MDLPKSLAHYDVSTLLGRGGMGEVVRARDTRLGREVALKLLPESFVGDPERQARFEREARLLALLQHPNVATVYGLERDGGRQFLVMELVEGEDLARRLARGPLPLDDAVAVAAQIAAGLEEAHERGIVHRDLKPGNVMLTADGKVKILDFGLARAFLGDDGEDGDASNSPTLTAAMTGAATILGTAAYMSPEQARGRPVDRRADIWALGVILYEMLSGQRLFAGETISDTLAAVLRQDVDLGALPGAVPPGLRRLIARCLERDPRRRLRDAGEARIALEDPGLLAPGAAAAPAGGRGRAPLWLTAIVVVAAGVAALAWQFKPQPERPVRRFELGVESNQDVDPAAPALAISPDGTRIAWVGGGRVWIRILSEDAARAVEGSENAEVACWSPDSDWLAFAVGRILWKVPADGGHPQRVGDIGGTPGAAGGAAWLPDGRIYVTTGDRGVVALAAAGGKPDSVVTVDLEVEQDLHHVAPLPGGGLVFVIHRLDGINSLGVWRDGERKIILRLPGEYLRHPCWSPTGHILYSQNEAQPGLWALPFDADRLEATGDPFFLSTGSNKPTVAADGTLVYVAYGGQLQEHELVLLDRQGRDVHLFGKRHSLWPFPAITPQADLAAAVVREDAGVWDLWVFDDRGAAVRMTDDPAEEDCPILTADGRYVIYGAGNAGDWRMMRSAVDGTGEAELLRGPDQPLPPHYYATNPSLSPDGRSLIYAAKGLEGSQDIVMMPLDADCRPAGEPQIVIGTKAAEMGGALSPDGRFLAYMSDVTGRYEVYVAQFPSGAGRRQVSVDGGQWPQWRSDGRELCYAGDDSLRSVTIELGERVLIGEPRGLFVLPRTAQSLFTGLREGFGMTPDARTFLVTRVGSDDRGDQPRARIAVVENWRAAYR